MSFPKSLRRSIRFIILTGLLAIAPALAAIGPVGVAALPGSGTVTDTDTGNGESWGRAGGRTFTFTINEPARFELLNWGAAAGTTPAAAFDGQVTAGTTESMTYNTGESDLAQGVAVWQGQAQIALAVPPYSLSLPTRFTLRVTSQYGAVPLAFVSGRVTPGIDVLASGPFTANLFFEAYYNSIWWPLLQLYDTLHTPPGQPPGQGGPAITAFEFGFYYVVAGLSLEEHDTHITNQLTPIKNDTSTIRSDTDYLKTETRNWFISLAGEIGAVKGRVLELPTQFPAIPPNLATSDDVRSAKDELKNAIQNLDFPEMPDIATKGDVRGSTEELRTMLLILFGLQPCPSQAGPLCETAIFIQDLATQANVDEAFADLAEQLSAGEATVHVEVVEVADPPSPKTRRWIVKTTRDGALVNAELMRILAISTKGVAPATAADVTLLASAVPIGPGLLDLTLQGAAPNGEGVLYQLEFRYVGTDATVEGSALVSTPPKS